MSEAESTGLAIVTDALSNLPGPVKTSFFKALGSLLGGLTAIPAAKLKQYAQSIEDTTSAKSAVAAVVAKTLAEDATKDPVLMQAAAEVYMPTALRKVKNRLLVAQNTVKHLADEAAASASGDAAAPPDEDWMNKFVRFAEDVSSERLQDLFGRVLAGQILRPGAFGLATLRALSELDQAIANDFSEAWAKSVGVAVDYSPEWQRGDGFSKWKRLSEAGFMAPTSITQYLPPFTPFLDGNAAWGPMNTGDTSLLILFQEGSTAQWNHIEFTRVGREIGSLLPSPDYEANMRQAANRLPKNGLTRIVLLSSGKAAEVIWQATP